MVELKGKGKGGSDKRNKVRRPRPKGRSNAAPAPTRRASSQDKQSRTGSVPTCPAQSRTGKCPPCTDNKNCVSFWTSGICNSPDTCRKEHVRPNTTNAAPGPSNARNRSASRKGEKKKTGKTNNQNNKKGLKLIHGAGPAPAKTKKKPKGKGKGGDGKAGVCFHWQQTGECPYGGSCRYEHGTVPSAPAQVKARQFAKNGGYHYYEDK